jgi:hypothetical protein
MCQEFRLDWLEFFGDPQDGLTLRAEQLVECC